MKRHLPRKLKLGYSIWLAIWAPLYLYAYGPTNFLWLCDLACLILLPAIWRESRLWVSAQACGVFAIQIIWSLDVMCRWLFGFHLVGGTEYMFDPQINLGIRIFSLFHLVLPFLFVWLLGHIGYHPRGWKIQSMVCALILWASYSMGPAANINWVYAPFGLEQVWLSPFSYLCFCMVAYPLFLFYPSHRLFLWVFGSIGDRVRRHRPAHQPQNKPNTHRMT